MSECGQAGLLHPASHLQLPPALHDVQVLERDRESQQGDGPVCIHALHCVFPVLLDLHHHQRDSGCFSVQEILPLFRLLC